MARINLYNYRAREIHFRKLRSYLICVAGLVLALVINSMIYMYLKVKIIYQQTRNSYLSANSLRLDNKLQLVNNFNNQVQLINSKIDLARQIDAARDDVVALFQRLDQVTPDSLYFNSIVVQGTKIEFNGTASSPLYIADFLQNLRAESQVFHLPFLKSNTTAANGNYNFAISADLESNLTADTVK